MASTPKTLITGYHLLTLAEMEAIVTSLGGTLVAGGSLRETGEVHWITGTGSTNESGFTAHGSGCIDLAGEIGDFKTGGYYWLYDETNDKAVFCVISAGQDEVVYYDSDDYGSVAQFNNFGCSVRLAMDTPGDWEEGTTVQDADGNEYPVIMIAGVAVMSRNLATTKYANEDDIDIITDAAEWEALQGTDTGAACPPNKDDTIVLMEETTYTGQVLDSKAEILVFGSNDCKNWQPVAGSEQWRQWWDHIVVKRGVGTYKFYIVCYASRIEQSEINNMEFRVVERFNNRFR